MFDEIHAAFEKGLAVPYLGPGVLELAGDACTIPSSPETLVERFTASVTVPHKIRKNLTAAAQYVENFKHRKTVTHIMTQAFINEMEPTVLHTYLAKQPLLPLIVTAWYDDLTQKALAAARSNWGMAQGLSQAEHFGDWIHYFRPDGSAVDLGVREPGPAGGRPPADAPPDTLGWETLLYQPLGSVAPATNFLVSDSDYVEVLTEIDIQTPIPAAVKSIRTGRNFLFLGCRFATQLERAFAQQVSKRSSDRHWAVLPGPLTKNEGRFIEKYNIERIDMSLPEFVEAFTGEKVPAAREPVTA